MKYFIVIILSIFSINAMSVTKQDVINLKQSLRLKWSAAPEELYLGAIDSCNNLALENQSGVDKCYNALTNLDLTEQQIISKITDYNQEKIDCSNYRNKVHNTTKNQWDAQTAQEKSDYIFYILKCIEKKIGR